MNNDTKQQSNDTQEYNVKTVQSASERLEEIDELSPQDIDLKLERVRAENSKVAFNNIDQNISKNISKRPSRPKHKLIDKKQQAESYSKIINRIQNELPAGSRLLSKVIHYKPIEIASDIIGSTIARPNPILFGAVIAFISTLSLYIMAKTVGYTLSGSETIIAFAIGWVIGLIYDFLRFLISPTAE